MFNSESEVSVGQLSQGDDIYIVERILDRRMNKGKYEYLLKWQGYSEADNTWEPAGNINTLLVQEFDKKYDSVRSFLRDGSLKKPKRERSPKATRKRPRVSTESDYDDHPTKKSAKDVKLGFERGLEPEEIIGASEEDGVLMFLMKWKGCNEADVVPSSLAKVKCPMMVIKFYEGRLQWNNLAGPEDDIVLD